MTDAAAAKKLEKERLKQQAQMRNECVDESGNFSPGKWGVKCSICNALHWEYEALKSTRKTDPP